MKACLDWLSHQMQNVRIAGLVSLFNLLWRESPRCSLIVFIQQSNDISHMAVQKYFHADYIGLYKSDKGTSPVLTLQLAFQIYM